MSDERTLVTGGAGFIGSHLVDRLLKEEHEVIVIDNFSNGYMENLCNHTDNKNLQIKNVDVADFYKIKKYFKDVSWVFHLAALADIVPSIQNPLKYHRSNVDGTISVLEAARKNYVKKFIYTASSSCYGIPDKYPTLETATIKPNTVIKSKKPSISCHLSHRVFQVVFVNLPFCQVPEPQQFF